MCGSKQVISILSVYGEIGFIKALKSTLEPDNAQVPDGMTILESLDVVEKEAKYTLKIMVENELVSSLKRCRATIDELLSLINMIIKTQRHI